MATAIDDTPPREVDGYDFALANGVIRRVPSRPPALLPGPTASALQRRWFVTIAVVVVMTLVVLQVTDRFDSTISWVCALATALGGFAVIMRSGRAASKAQLRELAAGYATVVNHFATLGSGDRSPGETDNPWDYRGVWVLDREGNVLKEPDPSVDPPGMYPSPNRPGKLELWTGEVWCGAFRDP